MSEMVALVKFNPFVGGLMVLGVIVFIAGVRATIDIWLHRNDRVQK